MSATVFYLTIIVWGSTGYGLGMGGGTLPVAFPTLEACAAAGEASDLPRNKGTKSDVTWVCTPVDRQESP